MMIHEVAGDSPKNCSLCGTRRASALWMAFSGEVMCCSHCALKHLPQLIADAVVADGGVGNSAEVETQMLERFQRAIKHAEARQAAHKAQEATS